MPQNHGSTYPFDTSQVHLRWVNILHCNTSGCTAIHPHKSGFCNRKFSIQWIHNYRILSVWGAVYIQMINSQSPDAPGAGYLHVLSTYQGSAGGAFPPPCQKHSPPSASICKFEESNWLSYGSSWHLPTKCYALFVFIYLGFIHT